ncbi:MAG: class I SAM-dependent methyltransferase family protein [Candidatus Diapherotrites archaeon]|nr:class I SAM-dependent methyltransferase family protein [Candidatus Diapherotrites archaeon]
MESKRNSAFFGIKTLKTNGETLRRWLMQKELLEFGFMVMRSADFITFPVKRKLTPAETNELKKKIQGFAIEKMSFTRGDKQPTSLKGALKGKLPEKDFEELVSSFDTLGNIAIIEIPKGLEKKEKIIGEALLATNKSIKTVCKKLGAHKGIYRAEPVKIIAGERNLLATYRESGCVFKVPVGKAFFSPRLATERLRIAKQIKKGEVIGAFFAGVGPFPIVFAKKSEMEAAFAIELNPIAAEFLDENILLNHLEEKVFPVHGDVKKIVPKKFKAFFHRIVMPLPKGAENFLESAMIAAHPKGCIIHFYAFVPTSDPYPATIDLIKKTAKNLGLAMHVLNKKQVRTFSKETMQIVVDFKVKAI